MSDSKTILITGAAGNLGMKLRRHLQGRYDLRLLDINPGGDVAIMSAALSQWDPGWVGQFHGIHTVVHLAGLVSALPRSSPARNTPCWSPSRDPREAYPRSN